MQIQRTARQPVQKQPIPKAKGKISPFKAQALMAPADNLEFMSSLRGNSMKLIVTSPPYNIGKSYEKRSSLEAYLENQSKVIAECVRLLHPQGSICWQVGNHVDRGEVVPLDTVLYPIFKRHGLKLRNRVIWHFEHGLHCSKRLSGRYETILWFSKSDDYTFNLDPIRVPSKYPSKKHFKGPKAGQLSGNPLGKNPSDVWVLPNVKNNHVEKTIHPCQFPVELVERFVLSLTNEGDSVFDPYMGVGSSVVAAVKHGRHGFGCDVVKKYVDRLIRKTLALSEKEQKAQIIAAGRKPIFSYNQTDFVKDRIAVEIQFGKYSFVAYDLFVKHMAFFVGDVIDLGIEILPMKELQEHMSSGPGYYEGELYNLIRQGRGIPAVPLILLGVAP